MVLWMREENWYGQAWTQLRGDSADIARCGVWGYSGGDLPEARDQPPDVLSVEEGEAVYWVDRRA